MKKNITTSNFVFFTLTVLMPLAGCANPSATIKVRIINEEGAPIKDVQSKLINIYDFDVIKSGLTDENGFYSDHLKNIFEVSGYFEKPGYYQSSGVIWSAPNKWGDTPPADTNFTVVLKNIVNPILMHHKRITTYFPRLDEVLGFDLEVGDWVFPDGKGKVVDIELTVEKRFNSIKDFDMSVTIKINGDDCGIQSFHAPKSTGAGALLGSELPPPQIAPDFGYQQQTVSTNYWHTNNRRANSFNENRKWIFRTRVEKDDEGNIISANYGWINDDFMVVPTLKYPGQLSFTYYYNPDPKSRSLELKEIADRQNRTSPSEGK